MKKIYACIFAVAVITWFTGCKKYLTEKVVSGVSYQLYETPEGLEGALISAYNTMRLGVNGERALTFSDAGTDLFTVGSDGNKTFNQYLATLGSLSGDVSEYWDYHYIGISECNVTLTYLPKVTLSESRKKVIEAEAKFLRSYNYFDLVQHFGKVPLILDAIDKVKTDFKRASVKDIYNSIIADLQFSFNQLPVTPDEQGRASKAAAAQLLAKVYLARGSAVSQKQQDIRGTKATDMDSVIYYANKIVNKELGTFSLVPDFAKL
ncbi:MAG TPA: RagB/SusD family nutrient uptake outer membrane protein, partial [Flavitalea sp.]|nr:RagB/SusD family nutrient uptake outer membrane protein [Flavitalea sp.]